MTTSAPASSSLPSSGASGPHVSLPGIGPSDRVLFVGDVHGCFDELQELVSLSGVTVGVDWIILTGDLVAKGPKSLETLRWVQQTQRVLSVRGNHDQHLISAVDKLSQSLAAEQPSGAEAASSDPRRHSWIAPRLSASERRWLSELPLSLSLPGLSPPHVVVHAGLVPGVALQQQSAFDLLNIRNVLPDGGGSKRKSEGVNWVERWTGPELVVFGHCAARGLQQPASGLALGLDTGCCYGNKLSGFLLPERRLLQVTARETYTAPDE